MCRPLALGRRPFEHAVHGLAQARRGRIGRRALLGRRQRRRTRVQWQRNDLRGSGLRALHGGGAGLPG